MLQNILNDGLVV